MGLTATFVLTASILLTRSAIVSKAFDTPFHKLMVCVLLPFAFQLDDFDSGLSNDLWLLVIAVIVVAGVLYVYRGPRHM